MSKGILNSNDYDSFLNSSLIESAVTSDCKLLNEAITNGGNINFQTPMGLDLIMLNLGYGELTSAPEYISCLIENGIDVNHVDKYYGNNALQYASRYGADDVVNLLIENGSNINSINNNGYNPLLNACESIPLFFPFYISDWHMQEMPYSFFRKKKDEINKSYGSHKGRKHYKLEQEKTIRTLLENDIEIDRITKNGFSTMDLAILNTYINDTNMIKLLKEYGVEMNSNITGAKGSLLDSLFYGGPQAFYQYHREDKLIKRKIKEYNKS